MSLMTREDFDKLPKEQQDALMKKMLEVQGNVPEHPKGLSQLSMEEFKEIINQTAKDYIKGMTTVDKKYFAFPGIGKEELDNLSAQGKFAKTIMFLKALSGGDVQTCKVISNEARVKANLSEGTTTAGGFLVPEEFSAEILRLMPSYGVVRQNARLIPMQRDLLNIPVAGSQDVTTSWVNEAAQITSTDPTFRNCVLTINKLASIPKVTNEL